MKMDRHPDERTLAALWLGSPQSVEEHTRLYQSLVEKLELEEDAPGPCLGFDDGGPVPVEELLLACSDNSLFVDSAVLAAQKRGITKATMSVLVFMPSGRPPWRDFVPDGELVYLGIFAFPAWDADED
jgi:hypothetical protein